ncbi:haloacid dehalogenase [Clostridium polyendosporum]|uniref:Haloacid dehalogenase n=1 Tax=Clostridium polyendosporum TaxID=69208 RepID=A0A919S060_9CLOT|nr:Cof-type HAD-IIB family hydrolase [Clostridium polyendosporum]GIM28720.1 haloacid dehalogenase [Clostridium polyendosporum]
MKYKLICIDMDGTLLSDIHTVSEENKQALKKATEMGVKIAITTGRLFTSAKYYSHLTGVKAPIISSNGAYIREKDKEEVIYQSVLNKDQFVKIYNVVKKHGLLTYLNTFDTVISEIVINEENSYKITNKHSAEEYKIKFDEGIDLREGFEKYEGNILKVICIEHEDTEKLQKAKMELRQYHDLEVVSSGPDNFEVMSAGTSKGAAVKRLAEVLGIKREEVICIGDSENDLSMIEYAGLGVAMGNASEEIKKAADYITDKNTNAGVAKAINKFILEENNKKEEIVLL